jgi:GDP-mannose 4,6 dehydratase
MCTSDIPSNANSNGNNHTTNPTSMIPESDDPQRPTVLVTGGCGYIGSHTIVLLLEQNYNVVVVDNLVNSSVVSLDRVATITGLTETERSQRLRFHQVDVCNESELRKVFESSPQFHSTIHFAGLKVSDSDLYPTPSSLQFLTLIIVLGRWREYSNPHSLLRKQLDWYLGLAPLDG